jgi:uncharacterized protein (DUF58 family)
MLYPDFNDLVALGNATSGLIHPSSSSVKSAAFGNHRSAFRGQGLEFDAVRQYVPGDDIRNIDWRVTARTGSPHLKVFQEERERPIVLCVDMNASMRFGTRNTFKSVQAARIAALLGWGGLAKQDRLSFCLFGDVEEGIQFFPPKRSKTSLLYLLKILAAIPSQRHFVPLKESLDSIFKKAHTGSLVYVISDFLEIDESFEGEDSLSRLRKKCEVVFITVNDPADQSIAPMGTVGFCLNDSEKTYINTESVQGRKAYEEQWLAHEKKLHQLASQLKIPLIKLSTQSNLQKELFTSLNQITSRKQ